MNTFNIEFPSICMRALLNGYSTCGMEYQNAHYPGQDAHYSGTFYWAHCDHLAALPELRNRFDPWDVEFWMFMVSKRDQGGVRPIFAENCGYSAHNCRGVNHYDQECPRDTYRQKVYKYVANAELPRNPVATARNVSVAWVREKCGKLRQKPYEQQLFYDGRGKLPFRRERESDYDKGAPVR
jgi:hypothetical protein